MHELSIAGAIADVALRHAGGQRVTRVEVEIGHLRQVVPSALDFAFELVTRESPLEGAELAVTDVPTRGRCRCCGHDGPLPEFPLACSACRALDVEVTAGEELLVTALEIDDEEEKAPEWPGRATAGAGARPPEGNRRSPVWAGASTERGTARKTERGTKPGGLRRDAAPSPTESFIPRR